MSGTKYDQGKVRMDLIPTELLEGVGKVLTFGATKYNEDDWRGFKPADHKRLIGAAMRHMEAYRGGEYLDPESCLPHLAHIATNCGFLLALDKQDDTWNALHNLISQLTESGEQFDVVLAIARGGLVPATYIAHALGVSNIVSCKSIPPSFSEDTRVLIVDDIADSGTTLMQLTDSMVNKYRVATIFKRFDTVYEPDFYGQEIKHKNWVTFPWEIKNAN